MVKSSVIDTEELWQLVFQGSPMTAAMALVLLDKELDGKIGSCQLATSQDRSSGRWLKSLSR